MTLSLRLLLEWAEDKAETDPDEGARPTWALIARDIRAYFDDETPAPAAGPDLFGGEAL